MTYTQTCAYFDCEVMLDVPDDFEGVYVYCKKHRLKLEEKQ
jgi:hypothetical protein